MVPSRLLAAVGLGLLLFALPGCPATRNFTRWTGLSSPPELVLGPNMPEDFRFVVSVRDRDDPPMDFEIEFTRQGKVTYDVTWRVPKRETTEGEFEISEGAIRDLYEALRTADYTEYDDEYLGGNETHSKWGVQRYYVYADGAEKRVWIEHMEPPAKLEPVLAKARGLVPESVMKGLGLIEEREAPEHFVGDSLTLKLYPSDAKELEDIPPERRVIFQDYFQALNHRYDPVPELLQRMQR